MGGNRGNLGRDGLYRHYRLLPLNKPRLYSAEKKDRKSYKQCADARRPTARHRSRPKRARSLA